MRLISLAARPPILVAVLFLAFLALYTRTAAPSVLSGDGAEFQLVAALFGVPHPTTYPLYVVLGHLATRLIPFGDIAWRVTIVSAICAACAVALLFVPARRITGSTGAALLAALALGVAPGLWNAATIAEVYALLLLLLVALLTLLVLADARRVTGDGRPTTDHGRGMTDHRPRTGDDRPRTGDDRPRTGDDRRVTDGAGLGNWWLRGAALVSGLGFTHHGLFVLTGVPLLAGYVLWCIARPESPHLGFAAALRSQMMQIRLSSATLRNLCILLLCFALGFVPWLHPLIQYARYGPFDGVTFGLPERYFWGSPTSWGAVFDLLTGGDIRRGIFRVPPLHEVRAVLSMVGTRLVFEFGPLGVSLGLLGCVALFRHARTAWLACAWVFLITLTYLLLIGPAVQDAPVFTLPMLLPWSLWLGMGGLVLARWLGNRMTGITNRKLLLARTVQRVVTPAQWILALLVIVTLAWGYTRTPYSSKRHLWLFRDFGQATLQQLPPDAAVIAHWEQGTILQYLIAVEGHRPDVRVDTVEPEDDPWGVYARQHLAGRPVFLVGSESSVAGLPVELVREDAYGSLFRLREE